MSLWSLVGSLTQPEPIGWQRPTKLKKKTPEPVGRLRFRMKSKIISTRDSIPDRLSDPTTVGSVYICVVDWIVWMPCCRIGNNIDGVFMWKYCWNVN